MQIRPIVLDFESEPIQERPHYPPLPVSFSLKLPEWRAPQFFAWGHKTGGNNTSLTDAKRALKAAYARVSETEPLLCFNNKFDMDVAETHFGLPLPDWRWFQDAMLLLFLHDPHQRELGLKPASARLLNMPPEEQDTVKAWVLAHKKQLEADFPEIVSVHGGIKPSTAGAFVAYVPGNIAGPYANGDVTRTLKMFNLLYKDITVERGMGKAYDRERQILPIFLRNEREGLKVDIPRVEKDQAIFEAAQLKTDAWLRKALKAPTLDFNKDAEVATALDAADAVTEWTTTATGRLSVSKKNLKLDHFRNPKIAAAYSYRQKCATILETFIRPWQHYGASGRMHTTWNQVRQAGTGSDNSGTRTGRPSSRDPNFLNIPRNLEESLTAGYIFPQHIPELPQIPSIRSYILPDERGHVLGKRDVHSQELRVFAHFEDGTLQQQYMENYLLDVHDHIRKQIELLTGLVLKRAFVKTLVFGLLYGMGLGKLAFTLNKTIEEVRAIRETLYSVLPGLKELNSSIKKRFQGGLSIRTWGGREYYCEPPIRLENGQMLSFEYKGLNVLVQGSSADITKQWIINYDQMRREGRFVLTVYDESDIDVPKKALKAEMLLLREAALIIDVDVPMITEGEWGPNLGTLVALKEPAPNLSKWGIH